MFDHFKTPIFVTAILLAAGVQPAWAHAASVEMPTATRRLGQFIPTTTSRAATKARTGKKMPSTTALAISSIVLGLSLESRPMNQTRTRLRSGVPETGSRPVQFGMAVRTKLHKAAVP